MLPILENLSQIPGLLTGLILIVLITMFLGLFFWAWSDRRKVVFTQASLLPLEDDFFPLEGAQSSMTVKQEATSKPVIIETTGRFQLAQKNKSS